MGLAGAVLILLLAWILPRTVPERLATSGHWSLAGGLDLVLVALLQAFSYPFHDPVMTDRGFIAERWTMLAAFLTAGVVGVIFITLFGLIGVYNGLHGIGGSATFTTAATLGAGALVLMNMMMLTSAGSTLDSTFTSTGKLVALDLLPGRLSSGRVRVARLTMIVLAVGGGMMVYLDPEILKATTISGTMVLGLTPVFTLFWWRRPGRASFFASVGFGLVPTPSGSRRRAWGRDLMANCWL